MTSSELTLATLFAFPEGELSSRVRKRAAFTPLRHDLVKHGTRMRWEPIENALAGKVEELLKIDVLDVITLAWRKYRVLAQYRDSSKYAPDETVLVPLAEHQLTSTHHPYVEILFQGQTMGKLVLDVVFALTLKSFVVRIQNAKIKAIEAGSLEGSGQLGIGGSVLAEKAFRLFSLPGAVDFGEGIPLGDT